MPVSGQSAERRGLAREVIELLDQIGDSTSLVGNELVQFDLRRNEILEDMMQVVRRLAHLVLSGEHNEP